MKTYSVVMEGSSLITPRAKLVANKLKPNLGNFLPGTLVRPSRQRAGINPTPTHQVWLVA